MLRARHQASPRVVFQAGTTVGPNSRIRHAVIRATLAPSASKSELRCRCGTACELLAVRVEAKLTSRHRLHLCEDGASHQRSGADQSSSSSRRCSSPGPPSVGARRGGVVLRGNQAVRLVPSDRSNPRCAPENTSCSSQTSTMREVVRVERSVLEAMFVLRSPGSLQSCSACLGFKLDTGLFDLHCSKPGLTICHDGLNRKLDPSINTARSKTAPLGAANPG